MDKIEKIIKNCTTCGIRSRKRKNLFNTSPVRNLYALGMNHGCAANEQLDVLIINSQAEYKYLLAAVCHFCKHLLVSVTKENTSEAVSNFFYKSKHSQHFIKISTDGGSTAIAKQMRLLKSDINYAIKKLN